MKNQKKYTTKEHKHAVDPRKMSPDNIYYDAILYNSDLNNFKIVNYDRVFADNVVDNPINYYLSIVRFSISHMTIPLYFFTNNLYSVTIETGPATSQHFLTYFPVGNYSAIFSQAGATQPVFYYNQIAEMINQALALSHLVGAPGKGANPPFIIYMEEEERFRLYMPSTYNNPIQTYIYFNAPLFQQFQFFFATFLGLGQADGKDYRLTPFVKPQGKNTEIIGGVPYLYYTQERVALYLFNEIQSITFTSNKLPATKEYITNIQSESTLTGRSILCDFVPDLSTGRDLSEFQFYPQGPYRLIDLNRESPLNTIDFQLLVTTRNGTTFPLYLEPNETVTVKFLFTKRSMYNNSYSSLMSDDINIGY